MADDRYCLTRQLAEIRNRILVVVLVWAAAAAAAFVFADLLLKHLLLAGPQVPVVYITPPELFLVKLRLALVAGLVVCLPLLVLQVLLFLFPALYARERRRTAFFLLMTLVFAAAGALFAYRIALPALFGFFAAFDHAQIDAVFDLQQYVGFIANTTVVIALGFESPLVIWFLGVSGIVSKERLRAIRAYVYLALLLLAAILTPADPISMLLVALPLALLYEVGVVLVALTNGAGTPARE